MCWSNFPFNDVCRPGPKVTFSKEVPFFANPMFFPSPPKTYEIPIYAEALCMQAGGRYLRGRSSTKLVDPRVLQFVDDCAEESDCEASRSVDTSA